jgi:hypothetical protein
MPTKCSRQNLTDSLLDVLPFFSRQQVPFKLGVLFEVHVYQHLVRVS